MEPRDSDPPPLRAAWGMAAVGVLLLAAGLAVPDERWQLAAWILGGLSGGVGVLTLGYNRLASHVPLPRRDARR